MDVAALGIFHLVTEKTPGLGRVPFRKSNILTVMAVFTKLFSGFFTLGFNQLVKLAMVVIVGNATGRFGWCLPEKGEDDDSDALSTATFGCSVREVMLF